MRAVWRVRLYEGGWRSQVSPCVNAAGTLVQWLKHLAASGLTVRPLYKKKGCERDIKESAGTRQFDR